MTEIILRHDDTEAALPHQIEPPAEWGLVLPDPVPFEVSLPKWCPVSADALVELHWWASLCAHLHVLIRMTEDQEKVRYRLDKALRSEVTLLRGLFGGSVASAIAAAGAMSLAQVPVIKDETREVACWTMAIQVAFGLLCTRGAAKGLTEPVVSEIRTIYEWIKTAFLNRLGDEQTHRMLMALSTGTVSADPVEKMEQWRAALAQAAEGAPEGTPGVAEALDEPIGEVFNVAEDGTRTKLGNVTSVSVGGCPLTIHDVTVDLTDRKGQDPKSARSPSSEPDES